MRSPGSAFLFVALIALPRVFQAQTTPEATARIPITAAVSAKYLAVAESAAAAPQARAVWQRRLDSARDTLGSVLEWYNERGQSSSSLRILTALGRFWNGPSLVSAFDRALMGPIGKDSVIRARALNTASAAAFRVKDQTRTRLWARESITIWSALGDSGKMGRSYQRLVQAALRDDDHAALRALADTGQFLCTRAHDADCLAYYFNMRGESARVLKAYDSAAIYYARADTIYRGIPVVRLDIVHNIGFVLLALGRTEEARRRFTDGLHQAVARADRPMTAFLLAGLASSDAADGKAADAAKLFGVSDAMLEQGGLVADPADAVEYERYRSRARTHLGAGAFADTLRYGRKLPVDSVLATLH